MTPPHPPQLLICQRFPTASPSIRAARITSPLYFLAKSAFAGTTVAIFTLGNLLKLPPYLQLGLKAPHTLWAALALAPVVPLGVWIGKALHDRIAQKTLFFWCYCLLAVAALKLVFDAARALAA